MTPRSALHGLALAVAALVVVGGPVVRGAASTRIYVTVLDEKNNPVPGLTAADFGVRVDGRDQEILSAGPATEPLAVAILTDRLGLNSTYTPYDVHQALGQFVKTIRAGSPEAAFALTTFDGPVLQLTTFASAPSELDRALGRLSSMATDAMMLDAVASACKALDGVGSDRRAVFVLVSAYRTDQSTVRNNTVAEMLRLSGASLWTVEVRTAEAGNYGNDAREAVIDQGGRLSGGTHTTVASRVAVETASKQIAALLVAQYEIVYAPGGGGPTSQVQVGVRHPGAKVLAPAWTRADR